MGFWNTEMKQHQIKVIVLAEEKILEYVEYIKNELLNRQATIKLAKDIRLR